jgi:hypothetical protein
VTNYQHAARRLAEERNPALVIDPSNFGSKSSPGAESVSLAGGRRDACSIAS